MHIEDFISWVFIFSGILILLKFLSIVVFYFFTIKNWKTINGKIEKSSINYFISDKDFDTQGYKLIVEYSYFIEGKEYSNNKISRNIRLLAKNKAYHKNDLKRFMVGNEVVVYYNPTKLNISLIDGNFDDFNFILLLIAIISILVGIYLN